MWLAHFRDAPAIFLCAEQVRRLGVQVLGRRAVHEWARDLIAAVALVMTLPGKVPETRMITGAALAGALLYR